MRDFPNYITDQKVSTTRHPWRSPVPYLFGGLAAMLGLIAFALLLLACSYWTLSRRRDDGDGEKQTESDQKTEVKVYEEKILVIMAGQKEPTFLATPVAVKNCVINGDIVVNIENKEGQNGECVVREGSLFTSDEENQ